MKQLKVIISLLALLNCAAMWGNDGDTFVAKSSEGVEMTFVIVSEAEKTCKVGTDIKEEAAIDPNQDGILTVPESVNGYTVVAIGKYAFYFCRNITGFHLPNTIKTIEYYAFYHNNWNLTEIDIPESVEDIQAYAFWNCQKLVHVKFHEGLKKISQSAFERCGLTSIELPKSFEFISEWAFNWSRSLATITVHSSVPPCVENPWMDNPNYFCEETYMRATLYVPHGTKDSYKADSEWGRFRTIKEGEPLFERPTDIAYPEDFGRQYIVYGNPVTVNVNFTNLRVNPISSISYIPTIDGVEGEEYTHEFPEPIAANGEPFTLSVTLPDFDVPKAADVLIDITKMNGEVVDYGADILPNTSGTAAVYNPVSDHRVLIIDYTRNDCLWALRSNIGFEKLKEKFGDKVIRASVDVNYDGPRWCEPFGYVPFTPTCLVDGFGAYDDDTLIDPYYGIYSNYFPLGILDFVENYFDRPHLGNLKILSAQWTNEEQTEINIVSEATIGMSDSGIPYAIEYILVEDGLKGDGPDWEQLNGYAGETVDDPNLQPLTQLPYVITDMIYNDLVVETNPNANQSLESFTYGESQQITTKWRLSELTQSIIQDKSKLSVVAYLRDESNGDIDIIGHGVIIDSYKMPIAAYPSGVRSIKQNPMQSDVYDLSGRKVKAAATTLDDLPKGVYIYGGKKIVVMK